MKCNPTDLLLLVDVGFLCVNPTYIINSQSLKNMVSLKIYVSISLPQHKRIRIMKLRVRKNIHASRTGVNRSSKYIIIHQKKGETPGMNRILSPTMAKHYFVKAFLNFLARDIKKNPSNIEPLTEEIYHRASMLTEGMETDLDEELPEDFMFV